MASLRTHARNTSDAFTLLELLITIAIIAVLAAVLLPTVRAAQLQARLAHCSSNLRQIGVALTGYADSNRGRFPETSHGATGNLEEISWIYTLRPYLGRMDEVRLCPLDPRREERRRLRLSSYVLNDYLDAKTYYDPFGRPTGSVPTLAALREPTRTPVVFVGADTLALDESSDHIHAREWVGNWSQVVADIAPDRFRLGTSAVDHSDGRAPYLYADGHVAVLQASALKQRILSGENFAQPR